MTQLVSDAVWLQAMNMVGAEDFDTGSPTPLRAVFIEEYQSLSLGQHQVGGVAKAIEVRTSDIDVHRLVAKSPLRRVSDGAQYVIRRFERGDGGMTYAVLSK